MSETAEHDGSGDEAVAVAPVTPMPLPDQPQQVISVDQLRQFQSVVGPRMTDQSQIDLDRAIVSIERDLLLQQRDQLIASMQPGPQPGPNRETRRAAVKASKKQPAKKVAAKRR